MEPRRCIAERPRRRHDRVNGHVDRAAGFIWQSETRRRDQVEIVEAVLVPAARVARFDGNPVIAMKAAEPPERSPPGARRGEVGFEHCRIGLRRDRHRTRAVQALGRDCGRISRILRPRRGRDRRTHADQPRLSGRQTGRSEGRAVQERRREAPEVTDPAPEEVGVRAPGLRSDGPREAEPW